LAPYRFPEYPQWGCLVNLGWKEKRATEFDGLPLVYVIGRIVILDVVETMLAMSRGCRRILAGESEGVAGADEGSPGFPKK
jgi:hypothetical protein